MKNNRILLKSFEPKASDNILLDTNILMDLFYPFDFETTSDKYGSLLSKLCTNKSRLLISSVQISEFINRCIRIQYELYKNAINNHTIQFKRDYRPTNDYREKMNAILDIIKTDIITRFEFIDDGFSQMDSKRIFIYGFSYDFNDALIAEIARQQNAILITDDADYANYGSDLRIVTSNRFLLNTH